MPLKLVWFFRWVAYRSNILPLADPTNQLTTELVARGIQQDQIGVITLDNKHMKTISAVLQNMKNIEVMTADKSGGKAKDCIIISLSRSVGCNVSRAKRPTRKMLIHCG